MAFTDFVQLRIKHLEAELVLLRHEQQTAMADQTETDICYYETGLQVYQEFLREQI